MRIEALLPPSGRQDWQLRMEDGSVLSVAEELLTDLSLSAGAELDEEGLLRLREAQAYASAKKRAAALLLRRPLSRGELCRKLRRDRALNPAQLNAVCDWAEQIGLLNEAAYAAMLVAQAAERGLGLYRVKEALYRHEIPKALWDEALADLPPSEQAIDRYLARHLKSLDARECKRVADALARRGFSWPEIAERLERQITDHR